MFCISLGNPDSWSHDDLNVTTVVEIDLAAVSAASKNAGEHF